MRNQKAGLLFGINQTSKTDQTVIDTRKETEEPFESRSRKRLDKIYLADDFSY